MKQFEKFLNESLGLKELIEIYLELRQHFQELGFSERDLVNPPTYTQKMMSLHGRFQDTQRALFNQVNNYGFNISSDEFLEYMKPILAKINDLTPLKENGSKERTDSWDEDFE
jgi:hypothetical protein